MDCKKALEWLPAHLDQELGLSDATAMDEHLKVCAACHDEFIAQNALRTALKQDAIYFRAAHHLEGRIRSALVAQDEPLPIKRAAPWSGSWSWVNIGATFASVTALTLSLAVYWSVPSSGDLLAQEVVASHVRSLQADHLADVASSDKHTVKPWFNGRLDFSPMVGDFAAQEFPLTGGRLDYLDHRTVAALVYHHRQHPINVFIWPAANAQHVAPQASTVQGYSQIHWADGQMVYWMISDLDMEDLMSLAHILQIQAAPNSRDG